MSRFAEYDAYDGLGLAALVRGGEVGANELLDEALALVPGLVREKSETP